MVAIPESFDLWPFELLEPIELPLAVGAEGRDLLEFGLGEEPIGAGNEDGDLREEERGGFESSPVRYLYYAVLRLII